VQLRRSGFPQLADEHEAKYGPGLFQQIDDYLDEFVAKIGEDGFQRILGLDDAKTFYAVLEVLKYIKEMWPVCADREQLNELMLKWDVTVARSWLHKSRLDTLFRRLEGSAFRESRLSDSMLEEAKGTLYGYFDELRDCVDIPARELSMLWQDRIKVFLCVVQSEIFDIELSEVVPQSTNSRNKVKKEKQEKFTTDEDMRSRLGGFDEVEDIYEEDHSENELYDEDEYEESEFEDDESEDETSDDAAEDEEDVI
jgi:hypothetical protein